MEPLSTSQRSGSVSPSNSEPLNRETNYGFNEKNKDHSKFLNGLKYIEDSFNNIQLQWEFTQVANSQLQLQLQTAQNKIERLEDDKADLQLENAMLKMRIAEYLNKGK